MQQPAVVDILADRWVACIRYLSFIGIDLTGATFVAQVRQVGDAGGSPLVDLATTTSTSAEGIRLYYAGTDTIANHITAGRLDEIPAGYASGTSVALSWVRVRINETTMEALPFPDQIGHGDRGDSVNLAWDMHITPSGGTKDKYVGGGFTVRAGATE
jgi:hypothetical protein